MITENNSNNHINNKNNNKNNNAFRSFPFFLFGLDARPFFPLSKLFSRKFFSGETDQTRNTSSLVTTWTAHLLRMMFSAALALPTPIEQARTGFRLALALFFLQARALEIQKNAPIKTKQISRSLAITMHVHRPRRRQRDEALLVGAPMSDVRAMRLCFPVSFDSRRCLRCCRSATHSTLRGFSHPPLLPSALTLRHAQDSPSFHPHALPSRSRAR